MSAREPVQPSLPRLTSESDDAHPEIGSCEPSWEPLLEDPVGSVGGHAHERDVGQRVEELDGEGEEGMSELFHRVVKICSAVGTDLGDVGVDVVVVLSR